MTASPGYFPNPGAVLSFYYTFNCLPSDSDTSSASLLFSSCLTNTPFVSYPSFLLPLLSTSAYLFKSIHLCHSAFLTLYHLSIFDSANTSFHHSLIHPSLPHPHSSLTSFSSLLSFYPYHLLAPFISPLSLSCILSIIHVSVTILIILSHMETHTYSCKYAHTHTHIQLSPSKMCQKLVSLPAV